MEDLATRQLQLSRRKGPGPASRDHPENPLSGSQYGMIPHTGRADLTTPLQPPSKASKKRKVRDTDTILREYTPAEDDVVSTSLHSHALPQLGPHEEADLQHSSSSLNFKSHELQPASPPEASNSASRRNKRNRVHFSCVECHRRKQKCDRNEPCGQCIARKVPHLCRPFINGVEDPAAYDSDVKTRLSRIEDTLLRLIEKFPAPNNLSEVTDTVKPLSQGSYQRVSSPRPIAPAPTVLKHRQDMAEPDAHPHTVNIRQEPPTLRKSVAQLLDHDSIQSEGKRNHEHQKHALSEGIEAILQNNGGEEVFHPRGATHGVGSQQLEYRPNISPIPQFLPMRSRYSPIDHLSPQSTSCSASGKTRITLEPPSVALESILHTLSESGITKGVLISLLTDLPDKELSDTLVELYFREIDWTRYKINRPMFMQRYNAFFDSIQHCPSNPHIDAETLKWLPLMYILLAIATLSAPEHLVGGINGQKTWSRKFYGCSRSALTCAKALQRDNLDIVYASLLTARFMFLTRRAAEGSTPLTSAFQLGLYRDGSVLHLMNNREVELRRRAWAMVYHLDRTNALLVGRPTSISDAHTDTKEPANLDDEELEVEGFEPRGHPFTVPTEYTQVILRHRLAQIMGRISDHTFAIKPPDYSMVLKLDQELLDWQSKLPPFFALSHPDTSLDLQYHYIFVQRHLLACEFLFARITLHRPYLLRKRDTSNLYRYSREAAIESAKADLLGRRAFVFEKPQDITINSGGYRVLNSYIVLGVAIKMEPDSPRAEDLRRLLDVVAGLKPDKHGRISDPIVKDELAIVEFLTQRSEGVDEATGKVSRRKSASSQNQTPAVITRSLSIEAASPPNFIESRSNKNSDDPAWSFVAPGMASLDVHPPFLSATDYTSDTLEVDHQDIPGPLKAPLSRSQMALVGHEPYSHKAATSAPGRVNQMLQPPSDQGIPEGSCDPGGSSALEYKAREKSRYSGISNLDLSEINDAQTLDAWWQDIGAYFPLNQNTIGGFNPFALAQSGQTEEPDSNETAFLNMLLSTIANDSGSGVP